MNTFDEAYDELLAMGDGLPNKLRLAVETMEMIRSDVRVTLGATGHDNIRLIKIDEVLSATLARISPHNAKITAGDFLK